MDKSKEQVISEIKDLKNKINNSDSGLEKMVLESKELNPLIFLLGEITLKELEAKNE